MEGEGLEDGILGPEKKTSAREDVVSYTILSTSLPAVSHPYVLQHWRVPVKWKCFT